MKLHTMHVKQLYGNSKSFKYKCWYESVETTFVTKELRVIDMSHKSSCLTMTNSVVTPYF
jgi:hypothetical protein